MSYNVEVTGLFDRQLKKLYKKHISVREDVAQLIQLLEADPIQGIPLGKRCYKVRLAIKSKGKGKSGGARVIMYIHIINTTVYLLTIYDKGEQGSISESALQELLDQLQDEL
jgi:mRNA-degrading endonuclease RelE of RelBE toxin-antitoxin system